MDNLKEYLDERDTIHLKNLSNQFKVEKGKLKQVLSKLPVVESNKRGQYYSQEKWDQTVETVREEVKTNKKKRISSLVSQHNIPKADMGDIIQEANLYIPALIGKDEEHVYVSEQFFESQVKQKITSRKWLDSPGEVKEEFGIRLPRARQLISEIEKSQRLKHIGAFVILFGIGGPLIFIVDPLQK